MPTPSIKDGSYDEVLCSVRVWRDKNTGIVILEEWRDSDRRPHRFDGPAFIERDPSTGVVTKEIWAKHGMQDREGAPAIISRDAKTGRVIWSEWHKDGKKLPRPRRPNPKAGKPKGGPTPAS